GNRRGGQLLRYHQLYPADRRATQGAQTLSWRLTFSDARNERPMAKQVSKREKSRPEKSRPEKSRKEGRALDFIHPRYWSTWAAIGGMYLAAWLPWRLKLWVGRALGLAAWRFAKRRRRIAE